MCQIRSDQLFISANVNNPFVIGSSAFNGFDLELGDSVMPKSILVRFKCQFLKNHYETTNHIYLYYQLDFGRVRRFFWNPNPRVNLYQGC